MESERSLQDVSQGDAGWSRVGRETEPPGWGVGDDPDGRDDLGAAQMSGVLRGRLCPHRNSASPLQKWKTIPKERRECSGKAVGSSA